MNARLFFVRTSRFACPLLLAMSVMGCGVPPQLWEGQWASLGSIQPLGGPQDLFWLLPGAALVSALVADRCHEHLRSAAARPQALLPGEGKQISAFGQNKHM